MKVVLAEKPSVAKDIAKVLGASQSRDGYIEGAGYQVTWAFGHLVGLEDAKAYGLTGWNLEELPVIPSKFHYKLNPDQGAQKQFNTISRLIKSADEIIVATDAGREGEHIFRLIYKYAQSSTPFKRLWISSLTQEAIKKGFANLEPGTNYDNLADAAEGRSIADWLFGINGTIALTKTTKSPTLLSVGRVQTPTLALICERYLANKSFQPSNFFIPKLKLSAEGKSFVASFEGDRFDQEQDCKEELNKVSGDSIVCSSAENKPKKEKQPLLYDLTTLQADANQLFGFGTDKTLELAQALYQNHKVATYPRTDSRYLSEDIYRTLPGLFDKVKSFDSLGALVDPVDTSNLPKVSVNDNKVSDHHAIIPTGVKPKSLSNDESKLFELIFRRFVASFSDVCIKSVTVYHFGAYKAQGTVIQQEGWRSVDMMREKKTDAEQLPKVNQGQVVEILDKLAHKGTTKAPELYTQGKLVKVMESAGKEVDDEELKEALKERGIGTPATRAETLSKLFARQYMTEQKNKLIPTELGLKVYEFVKELPISKPDLTGEWEHKLTHVERGNLSLEDFTREIAEHTKKITNDLMSIKEVIKRETFGKCPKCNEGNIIEGKKGYGCDQFKWGENDQGEKINVGCDFIIWKEVNGKKLSLKHVKKLIENGETDLIKGFKNEKANYSYDSKLILNEDFKVSRPKNENTKVFGEFQGENIVLGKGKFGNYVQYNGAFYNYSDDKNFETVEQVIEFIEEAKQSKEEKVLEKKKNTLAQDGDALLLRSSKGGMYIQLGADTAPVNSFHYKDSNIDDFIANFSIVQAKEIVSNFISWSKKSNVTGSKGKKKFKSKRR